MSLVFFTPWITWVCLGGFLGSFLYSASMVLVAFTNTSGRSLEALAAASPKAKPPTKTVASTLDLPEQGQGFWRWQRKAWLVGPGVVPWWGSFCLATSSDCVKRRSKTKEAWSSTQNHRVCTMNHRVHHRSVSHSTNEFPFPLRSIV